MNPETTSIISYNKFIQTPFESNYSSSTTFIIRQENQGNIIDFEVNKSQVEGVVNSIMLAKRQLLTKENFYITAIKNLLKKTNYFQLTIELAEKAITEAEFEAEIDNSPEKYIIDINSLEDASHVEILTDIVKKIGVHFSVDEVAELFSIDPNDILNTAASLE